MSTDITDRAFGTECINALDGLILHLEVSDRLGMIEPQEAANLTSRFLNLKAQVLRKMDLVVEAGIAEHQAAAIWTQPSLWDAA